MIDKDELKKAVEQVTEILEDNESGCGCHYGTAAGEALSILCELATRVLNGELIEPASEEEIEKILAGRIGHESFTTFNGGMIYIKDLVGILTGKIGKQDRLVLVKEIRR